VAEVVGALSAETDENEGFLDVVEALVDSGLLGTYPQEQCCYDSVNLVADGRKNRLVPVWGMRVVTVYLRNVGVLVDGDVEFWSFGLVQGYGP